MRCTYTSTDQLMVIYFVIFHKNSLNANFFPKELLIKKEIQNREKLCSYNYS